MSSNTHGSAALAYSQSYLQFQTSDAQDWMESFHLSCEQTLDDVLEEDQSLEAEVVGTIEHKEYFPVSSLDLNRVSIQVDENKDRIINTSLKLTDEFYCVISFIDWENKELESRVYDINDKIHVMDIKLPFSEFCESDISLIKNNAVFYWRIGQKVEKIKNKKNKIVRKNTNFNSFTMRRVFSSSKFFKNKINKKNIEINSLFVD
ncbi:hypothetical protein K6U20_07620 [Vibrio fluvialis]|uniref:hypothetical protein n=1 Tax=Vibrio fluvialis TaxID=676 RepID=UPI001F41D59B|nr:hypothetical protein [Vibrio fluvialis]ELO1773917.1 hypothetical protein [Vibrio fluvialis]ELO1776619.1 hypothetical protein [Vibrio fluvialis]MCE7582913.1 hypothetical protein [Vibrio fluvialis]MCG6404486.1 hypothetical protein [Vibrio fluvialis]